MAITTRESNVKLDEEPIFREAEVTATRVGNETMVTLAIDDYRIEFCLEFLMAHAFSYLTKAS